MRHVILPIFALFVLATLLGPARPPSAVADQRQESDAQQPSPDGRESATIALLRNALIAEQRGRLRDAVSLYSAARTLSPEDEDALAGIQRVAERLGAGEIPPPPQRPVDPAPERRGPDDRSDPAPTNDGRTLRDLERSVDSLADRVRDLETRPGDAGFDDAMLRRLERELLRGRERSVREISRTLGSLTDRVRALERDLDDDGRAESLVERLEREVSRHERDLRRVERDVDQLRSRIR